MPVNISSTLVHQRSGTVVVARHGTRRGPVVVPVAGVRRSIIVRATLYANKHAIKPSNQRGGVWAYRIRLRAADSGRGRRREAADGRRRAEADGRRRRGEEAAEPPARTRDSGPGRPEGSRGSRRRCGCRSRRGRKARCGLGRRGPARRLGPWIQTEI